MITDEQLVLAGISQCHGIGPVGFEKLLNYLTTIDISPIDFWHLPQKEIQTLRVSKAVKNFFHEHRKTFSLQKLEKELLKHSIEIVTKKDETYPFLLRQVTDSPGVLYVLGNLKPTFSFPLAIVGTRGVTSYGRMVTSTITQGLVAAGCEIISGFMYGVDEVAHKAALDAGGYTVGVLGYGFNHCYPIQHRRLKERLLEKGGALITEYVPSVAPTPNLFPQRNRIVAGMSRGVVVTEASADSGSKITARCAADYGRDVFAVPGSITSPYSDGTKDLINEGAKLVGSAQDILKEYNVIIAESGKINSEAILKKAECEAERKILELLIHQSLTSDEILEELQMSSTELITACSLLEMKGLILNEKGKYTIVF